MDSPSINETEAAVWDACVVHETLPHVNPSTGKRQVRILLIEDSEEAKLLVQSSLQRYGNGKYQLKWVTTLGQGLEQLAIHETDIVLLDLGLPESSGRAATLGSIKSRRRCRWWCSAAIPVRKRRFR